MTNKSKKIPHCRNSFKIQ